MTTTPNPSYPPVNPLPVLPVRRETYCSQRMADQIIGLVEQRRPDLLGRVLQAEWEVRPGTYQRAMGALTAWVEKEASKEVTVPQTFMGWVDLASEVSRRIRKAHDLPDLEDQGKPLAPGLEGPFPPLIDLDISPHTEKQGVTQEMVDRVLRILYQERADLCFVLADEARLDVPLQMAAMRFVRWLAR